VHTCVTSFGLDRAMTGLATVACLVLALLMAVACGVDALRDLRIGRVDLVLAGATEVAILAYVAVRTIDLAEGHRGAGLVIVLAYLIGLILVLPVAAALGLAEPSRWGPVVLASGGLVVCVMLARVAQLWRPGG
jgi:hypothetical protein